MKKRIVIASVLKPVSDTRMTEKIAATLAQDVNLDVHVIGYPAVYSPDQKITLHSFAPFARISFSRVATSFKILRVIRALNPSVLIVTTHELLGTALLAKWLTRTKVVYDIQENYYLNILHTNAFNSVLKLPIAWYVRIKETLARSWVDHFFLAEEIYQKQLPFARRRSTVLANKVIEFSSREPKTENMFSLVFTGTLSRTTGVFDAIALVKQLHQADARITLTLIGYASLASERERIQHEIKGAPFIRLIGGDSAVNHQEIVQAISRAAAGIIAYQPNPATEGRVPTKLYEYFAAGLPIVFTRHYPIWERLASESLHPFTTLNLSNPEISDFYQLASKPSFRGTIPTWVLWKSEENKLRTAISAL